MHHRRDCGVKPAAYGLHAIEQLPDSPTNQVAKKTHFDPR